MQTSIDYQRTLARMRMSILKIARPQPLRDARITLVSMSAGIEKIPQISSYCQMKSGGFLCFRGKCFFKSCTALGAHFHQKYWGIQRGESPWLWVSNRGEQHPVGTRLCPQSLVCYPFCDRGRLKGAVRRGKQTLWDDHRTEEFCDLPERKMWEFAVSKIRLAGCRCCGGMERICKAEPWNGAASPGKRKVCKATSRALPHLRCSLPQQRRYLNHHGSANQTLPSAVFSVRFAELSVMWKCSAVSVRLRSTSSSSKPKRKYKYSRSLSRIWARAWWSSAMLSFLM